MLNLDKYPDLTVELIQDTYKNKNIHNYYGTSIYCDYRNLAEVYPCQFLYIDDNGLPQNYENYVYSTSFIYDFICREDAYWVVIGYDYDDIKENTLILHRIGDYTIIAVAYKALEGAPMKTLTVEAPTDEDLKEDKDGNYSYIPVLYYPYAISNCPNLVSISMFNGYFMPLSISNIPNQIDLNLASKEDEKRIGLFALDAAFYKLDIRYLTLNYLNQVNIQGTKIGQLIGDEIYGRSGLAGCYNLIFTDCDVKYLHNNYFGQLDHTGSPIYLADEKIVAMPSDHNEEYIIGIIPSKTVATPPDIVINYQFSGQILPRIKDRVCSQPYNDYMLNKYKDKSKTVLFPKFYHFMP